MQQQIESLPILDLISPMERLDLISLRKITSSAVTYAGLDILIFANELIQLSGGVLQPVTVHL
jgi:hypothetical protein